MKKNLSLSILGAGLCVLQSAWAHEFWLMPQRFLVKVGELVKVSIQVGEHFTNEGTDVKRDRIDRFLHYFQSSQEDVSNQVQEGSDGGVSVRFQTEGTHLLSYRSNNKFIELAADKFNAYLKEDGLEPVLEQRRKSGQINKPGRELYSRCVKSLLQAGKKPDNTYQRSTGDRLELLPKQNPYALPDNAPLIIQVVFDQQPLQQALVRVWNRHEGKVVVDTLRSDLQGSIHFPLRRQGTWMVSVVQMIPYPDSKTADWQSFWGNLTFGFE